MGKERIIFLMSAYCQCSSRRPLPSSGMCIRRFRLFLDPRHPSTALLKLSGRVPAGRMGVFQRKPNGDTPISHKTGVSPFNYSSKTPDHVSGSINKSRYPPAKGCRHCEFLQKRPSARNPAPWTPEPPVKHRLSHPSVLRRLSLRPYIVAEGDP